MLSGKHLVILLILMLLLPPWFAAATPTTTDQEQEIRRIIEILKNTKSSSGERQAAQGRLVEIGQPAIPPLIQALKNEKPEISLTAAYTLGRMGPAAKEAVPALIQALKDANSEVRRVTAYALGQIGPAAQEAVPALIQTLQDANPEVKMISAEALAKMGLAAQVAIPYIVATFREADYHDRRNAARVIQDIAQTYIDTMNDLGRPALKQKISELENLRVTFFKDFNLPQDKYLTDNLNRVILVLQDRYRTSLLTYLSEWLANHKWAPAVGGYLLLIPFWLLLLRVRPLWLYSLNETLSGLGIKIPYLDRPVGLRQLLLLSPFHYCNRVLVAWVRAHLSQARASFSGLKTVQDRVMHVPVPVTLNGHTVAQPAPQDFQGVFRKTPFCLLICGEGGSGKTSLACLLAGWALAGDPTDSWASSPMLPILLEHDLKIEAETAGHPLLEAIHKQVVERLTGGRQVSPDLLLCLLRQQHLLVIVDHFSELSPETQKRIQPGYNPRFTINAMIVTSRQEEKFQGSVTDTLKPLRIRGNRLSSFMEAYLTQLDKRELYDDAEFFAACGRLTKMVGDRNLTVMLARLFADQMIAAKEADSFDDLPDNIPDLMLRYLNQVNFNLSDSEKNPGNPTVQRIAKAISWASLAPTFRPTDASLSAIHNALADEPNLDQKLDYLCRDLGIIQCVGPAEDKVRVTLDPVAEYLAGLRLLELHSGNELQWQAFLKEVDKKEGAPQAIQGFLLAVRDCCLAKGKDYGVPEFVEWQLAQKTEITQEISKAVTV
jgi:HEAT repeat protein